MLKIKKRTSVKASQVHPKKKIFASDEDFDDLDFSGEIDDVEDGFQDTLDDVADTLDDVQDTLEEDKEDETTIEIENNIDDHYVAECEKCKGIFISAVVASDQDVSKVTGECPLCKEESDQYLKWVVRKVTHSIVDKPDDDIREHLNWDM